MSAPTDIAGSAAPLNRREALRLLALGLTAGVAGCKPGENIVPVVRNVTGTPSGAPLQFATSLPLGGWGRGALATSVDGRPIKVSGNALHPGSLGATDIFAEAEILGLYDPDRSRAPLRNGLISNWQGFVAELRPRLAALRARRGEGLAILTGNVTSPTLLRQLAELRSAFPAARRFRHEPLGDANSHAGAVLGFGRPLDVLPHLERASVVLALGADPLGPGPAQLRNAAGFRQRRTVRAGGGAAAMQRLYAVESSGSLTGAAADHRLALAPDGIMRFAAALAARFGGPPAPVEPADAAFLDALAGDLKAAGAAALVLVGEAQPPELHALGHWLNARLGAFGATLDLLEPADPGGEPIEVLAAELDAGRVDTLVVLGGNPAYDAPADLDFAARIGKAAFAVHLGSYRDETGWRCRWHLPEAHPLESWSDLRAVDGTAGIAQPLIRPLYASVSAHELVAAILGDDAATSYDLVRATWKQDVPADFEDWWLRTVEDGVVPASAARALLPPRDPPFPALPASGPPDGLTLLFAADPTIRDGRYANNAWLQECPKPLTHETWGNTLRLAPADAARLGIAAGDAVRVAAGSTGVEAPVLLDRRQAPGTASLSLGYGREKAGAIGVGLGANAYALRRSDALWALPGAIVTVVGRSEPLPLTQIQLTEDGRDLAPEMRLADLLDGKRLRPKREPPETFYGAQPYEAPYRGPGEDYAWAMVIDTTLCIGCNSCVVACQAENNVPVVGPDEIRAGRTMHWLRIDTYDKPGADEAAVFQPVPCMHCEKAPCEPVCPVGASVHDHEGLNVQVYNRCIGTRFCQANCPYKVRRFNFFGYANGQEYGNLGHAPLEARFNPNVTVRGRGVMEKCTYCVQRIAGARQSAEAEDRRIRDGEVVTACQSACPTQAIRFGDLSGPSAEIAGLREEPQHYALLEEVGTKPRTTYLAKVRNRNAGVGGERT